MTMLVISAGQVDIKPIKPAQMGCGPHKNFVHETDASIEANFIILEEFTTKTLIISLDLLYVGAQLKELIEKELSDIFTRENIFLAASHTHYAPMTDTNKPKFGITNSEYVSTIAKKICDSVRSHTNKKVPCEEIECTTYSTKMVRFRRKKRIVGLRDRKIVINQVVLGPDTKQELPVTANLITFKSHDEIIALIWHFPCHPTSLPTKDKFSAHYVGEIRRNMRKKLGVEIPVIFFQGFSGDLRPPTEFIQSKSFIDNIRLKIFGSWFRDFTENEYRNWINKIQDEITAAQEKFECKNTSIINPKNIANVLQEKPLREFAEGNNINQKVEFRCIRIGSISIIGVSAELVNHYQSYLNELNLNQKIIGVGCVGDVFGYIPTNQMIKEGGYEAAGFLKYFELESIKSDIESSIKKILRDLVNLDNY